MNVYLDSSAIVKLYAPEDGTSLTVAYVLGLKEPLPFSHVHEIEVKNALRLKVLRTYSTATTILQLTQE